MARNRDADWIRRQIAGLMALTAEDEPSTAAVGTEALPGVEPVAEISSPTGRLARLTAALAVIKAQDTAAAQAAARQSQAAAAAAERGRLQIGRKPKDPHAALARAEVEHAVALKRVEDLKAERERRDAAAARGENAAGPRLRIDKAQRTLRVRRAQTPSGPHGPPSTPAAAPQVNMTDPDSRIMSTKDGWVQGYNAQAIVNPHQIVLACEVSQDASDVQLYQPMNQTLTRTLTTAGITARSDSSSQTPATAQSTTSPAPAPTA